MRVSRAKRDWPTPSFGAPPIGGAEPMALGELQSVAKNMCWFFHGIRRLRLWHFAIPPNTQ